MASEFIVSKMENFRKFVFSHPLLPSALEKMDFLQRIKFESLKTLKLSSPVVIDLYKEFLVEHEKHKENSPLHLTQDEGWIVWSFFDVSKDVELLAGTRPEKSAQEWETELINDQKKLLAYLNLVHDFYLRINSTSS
jgi:hypothetical protein